MFYSIAGCLPLLPPGAGAPRQCLAQCSALLRKADFAEGEVVEAGADAEHFALFSKLGVCYAGRFYDQPASGLTKIYCPKA